LFASIKQFRSEVRAIVPMSSVADISRTYFHDAALKTFARNQRVVAMILIGVSALATLVWTAAVAWSARWLVRELIRAIGLL
jgi:hypothetical protein